MVVNEGVLPLEFSNCTLGKILVSFLSLDEFILTLLEYMKTNVFNWIHVFILIHLYPLICQYLPFSGVCTLTFDEFDGDES